MQAGGGGNVDVAIEVGTDLRLCCLDVLVLEGVGLVLIEERQQT